MTDPYGPPDPHQPPWPPGPPSPQQPSSWPPPQQPWTGAPQWQPAPPGWQQPPPWGGQGWYGGPPAKTNGLAVASLVTGILALVPIGIGLGIAALVQINKRGERGRGMAIGGIVASGVWTGLIGLFVALGLAFWGADDYRLGDLDDVAATTPGTCLVKEPSRVVDCASPHDYEVYETTTLPDEAWPGEGGLDTRADDFCYGAFGTEVGDYYDSDYDYGYFAPTEAQWVQGRRVVVCVVKPFVFGKLHEKVTESG